MGKVKLLSRGISNFNEDELKKSIESLFKFNGSSHYLINSQDMINAARTYNRVYSFEIDQDTVNEYVNKKTVIKESILNKIK